MEGQPRLAVDVLSIFPDAIEHYCQTSIIGRARREGHLGLRVFDIRDGSIDVHRSVDDSPFGGGPGMVLGIEPVARVIRQHSPHRPIYLLSPAGRVLDQAFASELATSGSFTLLSARYEGIDERVVEHLVDGEISIGDYVLAGGELAALVVLEAAARLVPGVLGNDSSAIEESFSAGLLEHPHYTRPADFEGHVVPDMLLSGDHRRIANWRTAASLWKTVIRRPDLIVARGGLSDDDVALLRAHGYPVEEVLDDNG